MIIGPLSEQEKHALITAKQKKEEQQVQGGEPKKRKGLKITLYLADSDELQDLFTGLDELNGWLRDVAIPRSSGAVKEAYEEVRSRLLQAVKDSEIVETDE